MIDAESHDAARRIIAEGNSVDRTTGPMLMATPTPEGAPMILTTHLYFFRSDDDAPRLRRRDVMDAIIGRLPEFEWRQRIAEHGALRVAMNEFAWLFDQNGIETLFDPPVKAFLVAIRRIGDAPVYLSPLDLLRRFHALGWIPEEQQAGLPPEALEPPTEADAISLDRVLARFQPSGPDAHLTRAETLKEHAGEILAAIKAHVAEHTARHGALEESADGASEARHHADTRVGGAHGPS